MKCPQCESSFDLSWRTYMTAFSGRYTCPQCATRFRPDYNWRYFCLFGVFVAIFAETPALLARSLGASRWVAWSVFLVGLCIPILIDKNRRRFCHKTVIETEFKPWRVLAEVAAGVLGVVGASFFCVIAVFFFHRSWGTSHSDRTDSFRNSSNVAAQIDRNSEFPFSGFWKNDYKGFSRYIRCQ